MEAARLQAIIEADTSKGEASIKSFGGKVSEAGGHVGGFIKQVAGIAGGMAVWNMAATGVGFLKDQLFDMVQSGMDANATAAQTTAVLKSTHGAAGVTAGAVENLSNKLMSLTGIDDDTVTSAQNMLLTFTGIHKDVFPQVTQTALDMSVALHQDATSGAMELGKALNDLDYQRLIREGVTFTDAQKKQLDQMKKTGDTAGGQKIILAELNKEFGGSAEAAGKANGGIKILTAQFDNMKQSIGQAVIPIIGQLVGKVAPLIGVFAAALPGAIDKATAFFDARILPVLKKVAVFVISQVVPAVERLAKFVMSDVVPAIGQLWQWFQAKVLPILQVAWQVFTTQILPALENVANTVMTQLVPAVVNLWNQLSPVLIPALRLVGSIIHDQVGPAVSGLIGFVSTVTSKFADFIGFIKDHQPALVILGSTILGIATAFGVNLVGSLIAAIPQLTATAVAFASDAVAAGAAAIAEAAAALPFIAIAAGVALVTAGIILLVTHWKELSTNFAQSDFGQGFIKFINQTIDGLNVLIDLLDHIPGVNIPEIAHVGLADMGVHAGATGTKTLGTGQAADQGGKSGKGHAFASGGLTPGGPVLVGERGPELIAPPAGSHVFTADETRRMLAGGGNQTTVNIYPQKADLNAADLSRHLRRVALHASTGGAY